MEGRKRGYCQYVCNVFYGTSLRLVILGNATPTDHGISQRPHSIFAPCMKGGFVFIMLSNNIH